MKKVTILFLLLFVGLVSMGQSFAPPRSNSSVTVQDSRWRALLNMYAPHIHGFNTGNGFGLNNGLDTLGGIVYDDSSRHLWIRDTITGGHIWHALMTFADSLIFATQYQVDTSRQNMWAAIDSKIGFSNLHGTAPISYDGNGTFSCPTCAISGSGNTNSNIGSGYRFAVPNTNNIKTFFPNATAGISLDSTSNTNALTINQQQAGTSQNGYLSSTDWNTFNNKGGPITSSNQQVIFNNAGTLGGVTQFLYNTINNILSIGASTGVSNGSLVVGGTSTGVGTVTSGGGQLNVTGVNSMVLSGGTGSIIFQTNSSNRVVIDNSGNFSVNSLAGSGSRFLFSNFSGTVSSIGSTANTLAGYDNSGNPTTIAAGSGVFISGGIISSTGGGGGGNTNSNIGSGFRWAVPNTNNVKTFFVVGGTLDSTSNSNALTLTIPTYQSSLSNTGSGFRVFTPGSSIKSLVCSGCTIDSTTNVGSLTFTISGGGGGITQIFGKAPVIILGTDTVTVDTLTGNQNLATQGWVIRNTANSVSNSDGTLTISPTTGAVVASLALAHANTWITNPQTFNGGLALGSNVTFDADNVRSIGTPTVGANAIYSHFFESDGALGLGAAASNPINFTIGGGGNKMTLLSTGQLELNSYTAGGFSGTSNDSLLTINPTTGAIGWKWGQPFNIYAVQGVSPIGTHGDSIQFGGSGGPLFQPDTLFVQFNHLLFANMLGESSLSGTDSVMMKKANGELVGAPSSALPFVPTALNSGQILVGNASNIATAVTPTGVISITNTGVTALNNVGIGAGTCSNCNATIGADGRIYGYSSGTAISAFWRPEDFGGGTGVADNGPAISSCDSAAAITKGTCLLGAGTYNVSASSLQSSGTQLKGVKCYGNTTITGQGPQTIVRLNAPPVGATFTPVSPPITFSTNTNFYDIFNVDSVQNFTLENLTIDGNISVQINKDAHLNPYNNPQDGTTTPLVQTDAVYIYKSPNTIVYNVTIDSVVGYGLHDIMSPENYYSFCTISTSVNGGVYFADSAGISQASSNCAGSTVFRSLVTNNNADNIRVIASYITVANNEVSFAKPHPSGFGSVNFAGIYSQSNHGSGILGLVITGNYVHDNSAFGIDQSQIDTVFWTYTGQANLIYNNSINYNGAGGLQIALPRVVAKNNNFFSNGQTSTGFIDSSGSQCNCGVRINGSESLYADIQGNNFDDTAKVYKRFAIAGTAVPRLTFSNNTISGMQMGGDGGNFIYAGPPYNNVANNTWIDSARNANADFSLDAGGNFHLVPTEGTTTSTNSPGSLIIGSGTYDEYVYLNHAAASRSGYFVGQSPNGVEEYLIMDERGFIGGGSGSLVGREWYFEDAQTGIRTMGADSSRTVYFGPGGGATGGGAGGTYWSMKVLPPSTTLNSSCQICGFGTTAAVSTNFIFNSVFQGTMYPGATGTQQYAAVFRGTNHNNAPSNVIGGAGNFLGNAGAYFVSEGNATSGFDVAVYGETDSALRTAGMWGDATFHQSSSASAWSIGIGASALSPSGKTTAIYATMSTGAISTPTLSSLLYGDNSTQNVDLMSMWHNGSQRFALDSLGKVDLLQIPDSAATATGGYLFRDAATGYVRLTSGSSGLTFSNGLTNTSGAVTWGGTLTQNTTIAGGGGKTLSLGTSADSLGIVTVYSNGGFFLETSLRQDVASVSDANYTILNNDAMIQGSGSLTANRTITLPAANLNAGRTLIFCDQNATAFSYLVSGNLYTPDNVQITRFNNGTTYVFESHGGANWFLVSPIDGLKYQHTIFTPTTGGTVALVNNQYNIINPSGSLVALTVNLPSSPVNNDVVYIKYTQAITTVTYGNGTVVDGITTPSVGGLVILTYDASTTSWY